MLRKIKLTIALSILSCSIFAMNEKYIANRMDLQKAMVSTKLLPGLKTVIAQYLSDNWLVKSNISLHYKAIDQLSISKEGLLLSSSNDGVAKLGNLAEPIFKLNCDNNWDEGTSFNKDITQKEYQQVQINNIKTISKISYDGKKIIITYEDGKMSYSLVRQIHSKTETLSHVFEMPIAKDLTFSDDSKYLAISNEEGFNIFNIEAADMIPFQKRNLSLHSIFEDKNINAKSIVAYKNHIFIVASEQGIHFLDVQKYIANSIIDDLREQGIKFGQNFAIVGVEHDQTRKTEPIQLPLLTKVIAQKLAISHNSKYLAFLHEDAKNSQAISIMDLESENKDIIDQLEFDNSKTYVNAFAMSNDGQYLAIGLEPKLIENIKSTNQDLELMHSFKTLKIYNVLLREYIKDFDIKDFGVGICKSVIFSPINNDIIVGLSNGNIIHLKKS